jgi:flagellar biosynthesis component FlhA
MIKRFSKTVITFLACGLLFTGVSLAQQKSDSSKNNKTMQLNEMKTDHSKAADSSNATEKNSIVREGVIDLKAIDKNKDGKVYQDMMDYNVISDKPGTCPLCGMTLKEVSLKKAKEILLKSGFKVEE